MSAEYRNKYMTKVFAEFALAIKGGLPYTFAQQFLKQRMKHYGMLNKYLPHDFKRDEIVKALENDNNTNDSPPSSSNSG